MHEFIAKKGLISQGNAQVSGSLTVTNGITASVQGTASYALTASYITDIDALTVASASWASSSISASYSLTASYALNISPSDTASYAFYAISSSVAQTASYISSSAIFDSSVYGLTSSYSITSSYIDPTFFNNLTLTMDYTFKSTTSATDPGKGNFQYNSSATASITNIYIDVITNGGVDITKIIQALNSGSYLVFVQQKSDSTKSALFNVNGTVVNNTGWFTIPVSSISFGTGGIPSNKQSCVFLFQNTTQIIPGNTYPITASWSNNSVSSSYVSSASYYPPFPTSVASASWSSQSLSSSYSLSSSLANLSISSSYAISSSIQLPDITDDTINHFIGINKITPSSSLDVSGNIQLSGYLINSNVTASNSNFVGTNAGNGATNAYSSNFFGTSAGNYATDAYLSLIHI